MKELLLLLSLFSPIFLVRYHIELFGFSETFKSKLIWFLIGFYIAISILLARL